jgi:hypothetical protein
MGTSLAISPFRQFAVTRDNGLATGQVPWPFHHPTAAFDPNPASPRRVALRRFTCSNKISLRIVEIGQREVEKTHAGVFCGA